MPEKIGPALWADKSSQGRETVPVKVHCQAKSNGTTECHIEAELLNNSEEYDRAFRQLNAFLNKRSSSAPQAGSPSVLVVGNVAVETLPWFGTGAAAAESAGIFASTASAVAPPLVAAAVFGPSQAAWNDQNRLIQFADETEIEITVNVVVREGEASGESQLPEPAGGGGKGEPPNGYRTWREVFRDIRNKARSFRNGKFREWYNARRTKTVEKDQQETEKAPTKGKAGWFVKRIGKGLKEFFIDRGRYLKSSALDLKDVTTGFAKSPVREGLDILNKPGKSIFYISNGYAFSSIVSALWRRVTGSSKINPVGSDIFPEDYEGVSEPALGIFATASIGAAVDHYLFGWRWASAIVFEAIFALNPYILQRSSGGSDAKSTDWNRAYLNTFVGSVIGGPIAAYKRVTDVAFPSIRWASYLAKLENGRGKTAAGLLKTVPNWLAPRIVPSRENFLTYYGLLTVHGYLVLPMDIISDDANFEEVYKCWTAKLLSAYFLARWFDMSFDPFSRPLMGAISASFKMYVQSEYSKYFQVYKGTKFYRNILPGLARDNVPYPKVVEQIDAIFTTKSLFGSYNEVVPEDLYDLYLDVAGGVLTAHEKEYLYGLATSKDVRAPQYQRLKLALRNIFEKSYENSGEFYAEIEDINAGRLTIL